MLHLRRQIIILCLISVSTLHAQMKCEAGKCSTGKEMSVKVPAKDESVTTTAEKQKREHKLTIEQLFNVRTVTVKKTVSSHKQTNYGYIVEDESLKTDVTAWYSGFVEKLYIDRLYTIVHKGDALVKVYSPEVYKAKQDYLNSIKFNFKYPSSAMLKSAKIKLELLGVSRKEIEHIRQTNKVKRFTTIFAPASGWIFEKDINQGSAFKTGKKLFEIVSLKKLWVEVKLYQNELEKIQTLDDFSVKVKGINKIYKAKKSLLYPMLDPKEATATLRLTIDNSDKLLKPGMYVKVSASTDDNAHLVIPRTAAIRKNGNWYAFLSTEFKGEYEPVKIKLKPLDNSYFELLSGLNEGDTVVNNALFMMDSDAQINGIY